MRLIVIADCRQAARVPGGLGDGVLVQLRDKAASGRDLLQAARGLSDRGLRFVVNGRADVARAGGAAGVHLPVGGLPVQALKGWWPAAVVGCSTHCPGEARAAEEQGADYVVAGPVFATPGKAPIGLPGLLAICAAVRRIPVHALGGVTPDRVDACRRAGAAGVACIRAVVEAEDPAEAVARFLAA